MTSFPLGSPELAQNLHVIRRRKRGYYGPDGWPVFSVYLYKYIHSNVDRVFLLVRVSKRGNRGKGGV